MMLIGSLIIGLGYILMIGGGTDDPTEFSEAIFSFRRITLAPIVIILGFAVLIFTVMYRPKSRIESPSEK